MKIKKREEIFLSKNECDTLADFGEILTEIERESNSPNVLGLVEKIQNLLGDLWDEVEGIK